MRWSPGQNAGHKWAATAMVASTRLGIINFEGTLLRVLQEPDGSVAP